MKKLKYLLLSLIVPAFIIMSPNVYADCAVDSCGNGDPGLNPDGFNTAPTTQTNNHHELVIGILIGIGISVLVYLCLFALTKLRKKVRSTR